MSLTKPINERNRGQVNHSKIFNSKHWRQPVSATEPDFKHKSARSTNNFQSHLPKPTQNQLPNKYFNTLQQIGRVVFAHQKLRLPSKPKKVLFNLYPYIMALSVLVFLPINILMLFNGTTSILDFLGTLSLITTFALIGLSLKGLFKYFRGSWQLIFYASLAAVPGIFAINEPADKVTFIAILVVFWYSLYQLESKYTI